MEQLKNPKELKIAILIANFYSGGAEDVMIKLANKFVFLGHKVDLIVLDDTGPLKERLSIDVKKIVLKEKSIKASLFKLVKCIRKEKPNILLTTKVHINVVGIIATKISLSQTKIIIREATTPSMDSAIMGKTKVSYIIEKLSKKVYSWADGIIAVSEGVKQDMIKFYGLKENKIEVIYNPIISNQFENMDIENVEHRWFTQRHRVILAIGRVTEAKDHMTLVKAFNIVRQKIECKLIILGETRGKNANESLYNELINYIKLNGLEHDIDFTGFRPNPYAYLKRAEVFVLSSIYEGLPGGLIMALAAGCKLVSTDCPSGPSEVLQNGKFGELVPPKDYDLMALKILKHLETKERIQDGFARSSLFHEKANTLKYLNLFAESVN